MHKYLVQFLIVSFVISFYSMAAFAQEGQGDPPKEQPKRLIDTDKIPSLFFTYWQHQSIRDSKSVRGVVRPPTEAELAAIERGDDLKPDASERYLALSGIVFSGDDDWTIWFNGQRITPNAVPPEVLDLKVYKDYIELKWFDDYTNQVFPIRLRSHQRFNMDQRIFLPG
ncbi:MAG: hypothetical protein ACRBDI_08835 [Alphaproteobacteria bacterium]